MADGMLDALARQDELAARSKELQAHLRAQHQQALTRLRTMVKLPQEGSSPGVGGPLALTQVSGIDDSYGRVCPPARPAFASQPTQIAPPPAAHHRPPFDAPSPS